MSELDSVVKENQRRCFPNSRSDKQEQRLLKKYPELPESQARGKDALIAFYATQDDEPLQFSFKKTSSYPPETTFGSPPQHTLNKARKKSSKEGRLVMSVSPSSKSSNHGDLMFDMDEEAAILSAGDNNGNGIHSNPPSNLLKSDEGTWFNAKGKPIVSPYPSTQNTPSKPAVNPFVTPKSSLRRQASTLGWSSTESWRSPVPEKLPMREIIAQTSSSLGKSIPLLELSATPEKVSQKERKRQQHQHQQTTGPSTVPIISIPEKQIPKMWAIPTAAPRVSLKEVLMEESSLPLDTCNKTTPQSSSTREIQGAAYAASSRLSSPTHPAATQRRTVSQPLPLPHLPISRGLETTLHFSLADIMLQEEVHKEIMRDHAAKRSLQEIQAEQEFLRWWDTESEKVRLDIARAAGGGSGGQRGGSGGGGRKSRRGRGGGGRREGRGGLVATGRSEAVAAGQDRSL